MNLIKVLASEMSPVSLAAAGVLGLYMGLSPVLSIQFLLFLLILLLFKINIAACLFSLAIWKAVFLLAAGIFDSIGMLLLDNHLLQGLWTMLYNSPLYYTGFSKSTVIGGMLAALILCVPFFFCALAFIKMYRNRVEPVMRNSKVVKAIKANKMYKLYKKLTSPLGGVE